MKPLTLTKLKTLLPLAALPLILFTGAVLLVAAFSSSSRNAEHIAGADKLHGFDFSEKIAHISPDVFEAYPDKNAPFATYSLTLDLTEGTVYGISGLSATHAMTLWVDGIVLAEAGVVGGDFESMTPKTNFLPFTSRPAQHRQKS